MQYVLGNMLNGGGINPDGLSLDLQFAADKTLTARRGPNPVFTRGSTATFVGSNGLIQTAAINAPRFDHDPVTLACKGLLIEEGRTNSVADSNSFNNWLNLNSTVATSSVVTPEGTANAWKVAEDSILNIHTVSRAFTAVSGTTYTASVWLKPAENGFAFVGLAGGGFVSTFISVNLSTGAVSTALGTPIGASSVSHSNGWWRVSFSLAATASLSSIIAIRLSRDGNWANSSYLGNGVNGMYVYGAQVEAGSFPTSYIPTTTGTLARSADVCSISTAGWSNAGNDTMVAEYFVRNFLSGSVVLEGSPAVSWMSVSFLAVNQQRNLYRHGGTSNRVDAVSGTDSVSLTSINKTALTSGEQIALNGSLSQTLFGDPSQADISTSLSIGSRGNGASFFLNGHIAALRYYKKRLPNAKLQALTV
jgi:hypothetical protein